MFRKLLEKLIKKKEKPAIKKGLEKPKKTIIKSIKKKTIPKKYKNRFQKFYYLNRDRINEERRERYETNKKKGLCIKCKRKSVKGIKLCSYHRASIKEYNKRARLKRS